MRTHFEGQQTCAPCKSGNTSRRAVLAGLAAAVTLAVPRILAGQQMNGDDEGRLEALKQLRRRTGLTLDYLADLTETCDVAALEGLASRQ